MLLKQLYAQTAPGVKVILKESLQAAIPLYVGDFDNFPYKYADCFISSIWVKDNKLVVEIYD